MESKQSFIIMQIGNPELDRICEEAVIPALKKCGLEPKRVDKHNEGRLLKSEIVEFIQSSDIIVADLTNERPNCYLEVGYAMGQNKFRNLILTAREDHNQDSPNYKKGGSKIHFDLSGYDILFWEPDNPKKFREELEKRVRRRLAMLSTSGSSWDEEWISKHQSLAFSGLKRQGKTEFMEIRMTLRDLELNISQKELLSIADQAQINTFGWPLGIVLTGTDYRPRPTVDGIFAEISTQDSYDYWALQKDGTFYSLKNLIEETERLGYVSFNIRIARITETLLYSARLYSGFKVPPDSPILIRIRHGGLKDKILGATGTRFLRPGRKSGEEDVSTEVETTLEEIKLDIVNLVQKFTQPLFVIFDFFEVDRKVLEDVVNNFVAGRVT